MPRASPRRQPASKLSAAARRARHRHREAEWHWPESRHLAPQATSDAQHRAIGENEDFDLAAVLARRLTSSTIPMSRHNGSMQHLFNRSRSRPSWVMQGSAPRASERARGCQRHRRECSYRDPGCHTAIGPCRSRRRHRPRGRQRHRRGCSHRDSRCQTSIGLFHFAVVVDLGAVSGIGGNAAIAIPDVSLPSDLVVFTTTVDIGLASGIGRGAAIAIPDVMLLSGRATLLSPSTSGAASGIGGNADVAVPDVKRLSQFAVVARCNTSLIEAEVDPAGSCKPRCRRPRGSSAASAGIPYSRFPMSNFYRAFSLCRRR